MLLFYTVPIVTKQGTIRPYSVCLFIQPRKEADRMSCKPPAAISSSIGASFTLF
jgi:hypothetical protein